jgi:hypothetical protein
MPHISTRSATGVADDEAADAAAAAWIALRRHLEARNRALNDEVAHYPRPISRCDVQLSKLLEQRARLYRELERIAQIDDAPVSAEWLRAVERFAQKPEPECEDDAERALRREVLDAIGELRG